LRLIRVGLDLVNDSLYGLNSVHGLFQVLAKACDLVGIFRLTLSRRGLVSSLRLNLIFGVVGLFLGGLSGLVEFVLCLLLLFLGLFQLPGQFSITIDQ